jgi:hypothetical protein
VHTAATRRRSRFLSDVAAGSDDEESQSPETRALLPSMQPCSKQETISRLVRPALVEQHATGVSVSAQKHDCRPSNERREECSQRQWASEESHANA